jgi:transposase-like protein
MPRRYPPEFRRKVLDLLAAGRTVTQVAADLQISDQTTYNWRRQDLIDTGHNPGLSTSDHAELVAARRRIAELETELAVTRRAAELLKEAMRPKVRYAAIQTMAAEGLPLQLSCRVVSVAESGFYAWRTRAPSARAIRHAWLTDMIRQVHAASNGVYGGRRVHAELTLGRGMVVGHGAVELLMRRAGIKGLPGNKRKRPVHQTPTAADLVDRQFARSAPDQLWATDITEHPHQGGQGLLRSGPGRLFSARGGLVDRFIPDREPGHQRPRHGHRQSQPDRDGDPFRSRSAGRNQAVVATPQP